MGGRRVCRIIGAVGCALAVLILGLVPPAGAEGQRWRIVRSPSPGNNAHLSAVSAISPTDAWAVGEFYSQASGGTLTLHWDGVRWRRVPSPSPARGSALRAVLALSSGCGWACE